MAAPIRRDQLAARFADKLAKAPAKGARPVRPAAPAESAKPVARPPRAAPPAPRAAAPAKRSAALPPAASLPSATLSPATLRRGAVGGVVRGHLVPRTVHTAARRASLRARIQRGRRLTWDDVLAEALPMLDLPTVLTRLDHVPEHGDRSPAMVQATITEAQDLAFAELRLDVADATGTTVRFERLWALALLLWTEAQSAS